MRHERMRREDLEHLVRAAGTIIRDDHLVVIGSQSVHGTFDDDDLPSEAMFSMEADLLPNDDPETKKADLIDGVLGEDSLFHETFGYYAQGVDQHTAVLPNGWKDRLRPLSNANTRGVTGWCLEPHDLAVGWRADQFKNGSIRQSERLAKYNRLLEIAETTGWTLAAWRR